MARRDRSDESSFEREGSGSSAHVRRPTLRPGRRIASDLRPHHPPKATSASSVVEVFGSGEAPSPVPSPEPGTLPPLGGRSGRGPQKGPLWSLPVDHRGSPSTTRVPQKQVIRHNCGGFSGNNFAYRRVRETRRSTTSSSPPCDHGWAWLPRSAADPRPGASPTVHEGHDRHPPAGLPRTRGAR
jgi:hypothetical protein